MARILHVSALVTSALSLIHISRNTEMEHLS